MHLSFDSLRYLVVKTINLALVICALLTYQQWATKANAHDELVRTQIAEAERAASRGPYAHDGSFEGTAEGYGGPVSVRVEVRDGFVEHVEITDAQGEDPSFLAMCQALCDAMVVAQSPQVDVVSGATYTSRGVMGAAEAALNQSAEGGRMSVDEGKMPEPTQMEMGEEKPATKAVPPARPAKGNESSSLLERIHLVLLPEKPLSLARQRERTALMHAALRRFVQLIFLILAPAAFSNTFHGVKYLFLQIGAREAFDPSVVLPRTAPLLAFTVVFGRFFCGYACAFGTAGDLLYGLTSLLCERLGIRRPSLPVASAALLAKLKYLVLAGICLACVAGVWAMASDYSPWVGFASLMSGNLAALRGASLAVLIATAVLMALDERAFCHYLCPLGALFSLLPVLPFSQFVRTRAHCARNCGRCQKGCPVDIWPDADVPAQGECISCGRCADACPMANVNMLAIRRAGLRVTEREKAQGEPGAHPTRKTRKDWWLLRGNENAYVLLKALLLLMLLNATGGLRFPLPLS